MRLHTGTGLIHPDRILDRVGICVGHDVADIGCGSSGHFVFPLAKRVGADGRVFAVDIQRRVLDVLQRVAQQEQLFNVESVWGDADRHRGIRLEDERIDVAFIVNTLSSSQQPLDFVAEIARLLRRDGIAVVLDWHAHAMTIGPQKEERIAQETAREWFERGSFRLEDEFRAGPYHYGCVFRKV
ncbi:MAG: methyltransferase domain-containing protein [bacterium]|nr:methyltransferase domain-containing protein [bacterium]